jgi:hypothetical protein
MALADVKPFFYHTSTRRPIADMRKVVAVHCHSTLKEMTIISKMWILIGSGFAVNYVVCDEGQSTV